MINQEQLDTFQERLETLKEVSRDNISFKSELADIHYPKLVQELLDKLEECLAEKEDKIWKKYLLDIGVTNLDDDDEISRMLDKIEKENSAYETNIIEALDEFFDTPQPQENISKKQVRAWLESLGD